MKNAISAGHEITLSVAKEILLAGGNAFDAAIAAHAAMFITEPCMASAGGAGFAIVKPHDHSSKYIDFFCQTPQKKHTQTSEFTPIEVNFGDDTETFFIGLGSTAVPGTIAGLFEIHRQWGTIPISELFQPAISLAKEGVILNAFQAYDLVLLKDIFSHSKRGKEIFCKNENIKIEGDKITMPYLADFLETLGIEGEALFYKGEIATLLDEESQNAKGYIRKADLENYKVNVSDPFTFKYKNKFIQTVNGPSRGGAAMALMLNQINNKIPIPLAIEFAQNSINSSAPLHEIIKRNIGSTNFKFETGSPAHKGTSHFNILDKHKNAITLTSSIGEGNGHFLKGTDIHLNNMLGEIFLLPKGAHSWAPASRLNSMMTPTIVLDEEQKLKWIAGSGGASRIPYAIGQVIFQLFEKNSSLIQSTEQGRFHFQDDCFHLEKGTGWDPKNRKHNRWTDYSLFFGGVHSILLEKDEPMAIGDKRRHGVAEVF